MEYDVLAFIGRFQPFHMGHKAVVDTALTRSKKVGLVIGSDQQPRTARNPFTTQERIEMISAVYPDAVASGALHFVLQVDHVYNLQRWIGGIQTGIMTVANTPFTPDPVRTGLIGHSKDTSSFYLKSFPTWDAIEVPNFNNLNATDIRRSFFADANWNERYGDFIPEQVRHFLNGFEATLAFEDMCAEQEHLLEYGKQFIRPSDEEIVKFVSDDYGGEDAIATRLLTEFANKYCPKYPPVFYTADAIVVQSGHILMVKRGAQPGKGLWALPGGFVNRYESPRQAAVRELKEETKINLHPDTLNRSITSWRVFDDPYRSQRGRTVTTAYKIELRDSETLPDIKGSDDAEKAKWVPIGNLKREIMFEDHYDIIEAMVNI